MAAADGQAGNPCPKEFEEIGGTFMKVKRKIRSLLVSLLCAMLLAGVLPTAALAEDQIPTDTPRYTTGVSRSKTATPLDTTTWTSDVKLSLPSAEEKLDSDVVFVLDGSSSADSGVVDASLSLLRDLKDAAEDSGAAVNVCVVKFKRQNGSIFPRTMTP